MVILDKEKMLDTQNRRALALVRANPDAVYAQDSAGTMFISGIIHLEKLNDNEREKALGDLETYLRKFLRLPEADLTRFKRLIKIPTIRSALTILTKTLWGRDHFSGYRAEQLTAPRVAPVSQKKTTVVFRLTVAVDQNGVHPDQDVPEPELQPPILRRDATG